VLYVGASLDYSLRCGQVTQNTINLLTGDSLRIVTGGSFRYQSQLREAAFYMPSNTLRRPVMPAARRGPGNVRTGRFNRNSVILAVILTCQLMVLLDATIVNVALPDMRAALHFSDSELSWVLNAYTLTFGGLLLLGARAGDLLGRRITFLSGIAVFTLASLAGGFATTSWFLLAARALQGVGGAFAAPSSLALLTTMFPEGRERIRALALFTAASIGGGAIGLIAGGMLTQWASWRWVLFVNVPIGLAVFVVGRLVLPETPRHTGRFDLAGAVTSTSGIGLLVYGFVRAASEGWSDPLTIASFGIGLALITLFVFAEIRAEEPITPLRLLTNPARSGANVARGLLAAGMFGMFFFLTQFLQDVLGYSPLETGFAFLPIPLTVFIGSQLTARIFIHRIPIRLLTTLAIALSAAGLLILTQLSANSTYPVLLVTLMMFGFGNGISFVTLTAIALTDVAPQDAGAASGLVNVMQQLGGTLGVAVLVTIFGSASKTASAHPIPHADAVAEFNHVFVYAADRVFVTAAIFFIAALALVLVTMARRTSNPAPASREPVRATEALAVD
jgi:EmrB/QacA subfamily drug resistance transporter